MKLAEDGEKFWGTTEARQGFLQSIVADSIKGIDQVYRSCIKTHVLFYAFLLNLPQWGAADAEIKVPSGEN